MHTCYVISVMSHSLWPYGLQPARLPCPSPSLGACSNSCPLSWWCDPTISSSVILFSACFQSFPASGFFSHESAVSIRWPKYGSFHFNVSSSSEYSEFISFRIDWFDLLWVQGILKSVLQHDSCKASILWSSAILWSNSHICTWLLGNHSFDYPNLCQQSDKVPLPFLNPAYAFGISWFTHYWILAWRILSITLLACEMSVVVW